MSRQVTLVRVAHLLPFTIQSIYNSHCARRWPWLSRVGPEGRTRELWVDLEILGEWAKVRGLKLNLDEVVS